MSFYTFFERNILENPEILYIHQQENYYDIANYYNMKVNLIYHQFKFSYKNLKWKNI
jgi:hypothetical protein